MSTPFESLPEEALRLEFMAPGQADHFHDGYVHEKIVPCAILAQPMIGCYEITCQDRTAWIPTGELFLTAANLPLRIVHHGDPQQGHRMAARWLHIHFTLFDTIDFLSLLTLPLHIGPPDCHAFGTLIERLLAPAPPSRVPGTDPLTRVIERNALGFEALRLIGRLNGGGMREGALTVLAESRRLQPVVAYMKHNLHRALTVEDLAARASMSPATLFRAFERSFGLTPQRYLKRLRLAVAQRQLVATHRTLQAIALDVGFATPFHFSREFKRETGYAPGEFRRRNQRMAL